VAIIQDPIPQLGELYQKPTTGADAAGWFRSIFEQWAGPLGGVEGALVSNGSALSAITPAVDSLAGSTKGALGDLNGSNLVSLLTTLNADLTQQNPVGGKIPWKVTVHQLPRQESYTSGMAETVRGRYTELIQRLWGYLWGSGGPPPNL
jgi:hypothetical protein